MREEQKEKMKIKIKSIKQYAATKSKSAYQTPKDLKSNFNLDSDSPFSHFPHKTEIPPMSGSSNTFKKNKFEYKKDHFQTKDFPYTQKKEDLHVKDFQSSQDDLSHPFNQLGQKNRLEPTHSEIMSWLKSFNQQISDLYKYINSIEDRLDRLTKDFNFSLGSTLNQLKQTETSIKSSLQQIETRVSLLNACLLEKKLEEVEIKNLKNFMNQPKKTKEK